MSGLGIGSRVVTRRGKRGTVVAVHDDGGVDVRFGGRVFTVRATSLVLAREYDKWGKHTKGINR